MHAGRGTPRPREQGLRESSRPPWALSRQFHSLLGGSGPTWSSYPTRHHMGLVSRRKKKGQLPLPVLHGRSHLPANLSAPSKASSFRGFHGVKCVHPGTPHFRIKVQISWVHQVRSLSSISPFALQLLQFCCFYPPFLLFLKYVCAI